MVHEENTQEDPLLPCQDFGVDSDGEIGPFYDAVEGEDEHEEDEDEQREEEQPPSLDDARKMHVPEINIRLEKMGLPR